MVTIKSLYVSNNFRLVCRTLVGNGLGRNAKAFNQRFIRPFRSLNLLTQDFTRVFVLLYGSIHVGVMAISIFCAYGAIRFDGALALSLGWIGFNVIDNLLGHSHRALWLHQSFFKISLESYQETTGQVASHG